MKNIVLQLAVGISIIMSTGCNNANPNKTENGLEQTKTDSVQSTNQENTAASTGEQSINPAPYSQSNTSDSLSQLMEGNMTFKLPTTSGRIISSIGKYSKIDYENWDENPSGWGNRYIWQFSSGLVLTAQSDGDGNTPNNKDGVRSIILEATNNNSIEALIYGLIMNKTTKNDCQTLFGSKLKSSTFGKNTYKVYKDNLYTYLTFNPGGILISIRQVSFDLESAG
jgi:hypothetical protein